MQCNPVQSNPIQYITIQYIINAQTKLMQPPGSQQFTKHNRDHAMFRVNDVYSM